MALRGSSSTTRTSASRCILPSLGFTHSASSGPVARADPARVTKATGVSPQRSDGTPITAASSTAGCASSAVSRSMG